MLEERAEDAIKTKTEQARELAALRQQMQDREAELKMVLACESLGRKPLEVGAGRWCAPKLMVTIGCAGRSWRTESEK